MADAPHEQVALGAVITAPRAERVYRVSTYANITVADTAAAAVGVEIDLRTNNTLVAGFAPFEHVTLISAVATITLFRDAVHDPIIYPAWVPSSWTNSEARARYSFDHAVLQPASASAEHFDLPVDCAHYGTELKSAVLGNQTPKFIIPALPHSATDHRRIGSVQIRVTYTGRGFSS
jgi:hypothetical protein